MHELIESINGLADLIEAKTRKARTRKLLYVGAFGAISATGRLKDPLPISRGDDLYIARTHEPGAGLITLDKGGRRFATALGSLAAGTSGRMQVALYEKAWITDGNPCEICDENAIAGWIPADEEFPSGDDEPDAHPNCKCSLDVRPTFSDSAD